MKRLIILLCSIILLAVPACSADTTSSLPEPTDDGVTVKIIVPTATVAVPTEIAPTPTVTPISYAITQSEMIDISSPLSGISIPNPVIVTGVADSTFEQNLTARLVGLDGVELGTGNFTIQADSGQRGPFSGDISYSNGENKDALLQVFSISARDGSLEHLNSVLLKLEPVEDKTENLRLDTEMLQITSIKILQVSGKLELQAEGLASNLFENSLKYKLCGDGGNGSPDFVCGSVDNVMIAGVTEVQTEEMGDTGPFVINMPLQNGQWQFASLVVYNTSPANGEIQHATSQIIKNGP